MSSMNPDPRSDLAPAPGLGPDLGPDRAAAVDLASALDRLVARGALTSDQAAAVLAEVAGTLPGPSGPPRPATPEPRRRRPVSQLLVEVGLYVGSALVVAALFVLVAQSWEGLTRSTQVATLAATTLVGLGLGLAAARGAAAATARRRLAGVLLAAASAAAGGTVSLVVGDIPMVGVVSLTACLAVLVLAQVVAASAVTEVGLFVVSFALVQALGDQLRPSPVTSLDPWGNEIYEPSRMEQLMPLGTVALGLGWALGVSRLLQHRELAVALGALATVGAALPLAGDEQTRAVGLVVLAGAAAIGFWRFLVEPLWPWLALAIASVTGFVFWLVGGAHRPALAILAAGLVLLATSAGSLQWSRHRARRSRHRAS